MKKTEHIRDAHLWKIRIDDGHCEYEYEITTHNGNHSIYEVYLGICAILETQPDINEGKFIKWTK